MDSDLVEFWDSLMRRPIFPEGYKVLSTEARGRNLRRQARFKQVRALCFTRGLPHILFETKTLSWMMSCMALPDPFNLILEFNLSKYFLSRHHMQAAR
mmetsp:Transcript_61671/g.115319  ORF Transcript_61671/g.115319 Transcript_61671/m.115319 type:complete len:98 (-) Transcript_61671:12-305(-)